MITRLSSVGLCLLWLASFARGAAPAPNWEELATAPSWEYPSREQVRERVLTWLDEHAQQPRAVEAVTTLWSQARPEEDLLELTVASLAVVEPDVARWQTQAEGATEAATSAEEPDLWETLPEGFAREQVRLFYGRWLAQHEFYDEAGAALRGLQPEEVVDPAALLFYRGLVHRQLLEREPGVETLDRLLEREQEIPRRFARLGQLLRADLAALEDETLDHISRRMADIRRRLGFGRTGDTVQNLEKGVIESLDKLIDDLEKQRQQQQMAASAGGSGSNRSSRPAEESLPMGGKGPGEVTKRPIGNRSGWGELDPKDREEALQQIGRDFPAHYRNVIEQYYRQLAQQAEQP